MIGVVVKNSFEGMCPTISCSCEHTATTTASSSSFPSRPVLRYDVWSKAVERETATKYEKLCSLLMAFLCSGCHTLKSIQMNKATEVEISCAKETLQKSVLAEYHEAFFDIDLHHFEDGLLSTDLFYETIVSLYIPSLSSGCDASGD